MKTFHELCLYWAWFLRMVHAEIDWIGCGPLTASEEAIMAIAGLIVAGLVLLVTSALFTEFLWEAVRRIMHFPDDWMGAVAEEDER